MAQTHSDLVTLKKGMHAPDFSLPGVDGKNHSLSDFANAKALLIVFMCNHCPFVVPKIPKLVSLQEKYGLHGLQIVGISANDPDEFPQDSFENMKKFFAEKKMNFPYLFDETQSTAKAYGAACTPDPFLFNEQRALVFHGRIDDAHGEPHEKATTNELEEATRQLLDKGFVANIVAPSLGCSIKWKK